MSDEADTPPADEVLVARPFEGFEREAAPPAPGRSLARGLFDWAGTLLYTGLSALLAFGLLAAVTPRRGLTGSTRASQERRLERERAVAEALAGAELDRAAR